MKKSLTQTATHWKTSTNKMFASSSLGKLVKKPQNQVVKALGEKTLALKLMSLDLASAGTNKK